MKNVLVPLDGTTQAANALTVLTKVCSPGDRIVLLSVSKPEKPTRTGAIPGDAIAGGFAGPSGGGVSGAVKPDTSVYQETKGQVFEREINESRDYLEGQADALKRAGFDVAIEALIEGDAAKAIVDYARKVKPAFIVLQRRTHFGERVFGGVAQHVLEAEVAPVLFVPPAQAVR